MARHGGLIKSSPSLPPAFTGNFSLPHRDSDELIPPALGFGPRHGQAAASDRKIGKKVWGLMGFGWFEGCEDLRF